MGKINKCSIVQILITIITHNFTEMRLVLLILFRFCCKRKKNNKNAQQTAHTSEKIITTRCTRKICGKCQFLVLPSFGFYMSSPLKALQFSFVVRFNTSRFFLNWLCGDKKHVKSKDLIAISMSSCIKNYYWTTGGVSTIINCRSENWAVSHIWWVVETIFM